MSFRFVEPRVRVGDGIVNFSGAKYFFFIFGTDTAKKTFSDSALTTENTDPVVADSNGLFPDIFTDTKGTVTLKSSTDTIIYGPIDFFAPEDGITALAASSVAVEDAAGDFAGTNVEAVLTEISNNFLNLSRINTITAIQTFVAALQMSDQELRRPLLLDYAIKHNSISSSSGTLEIDLTTGNSFVTTLTSDDISKKTTVVFCPTEDFILSYVLVAFSCKNPAPGSDSKVPDIIVRCTKKLAAVPLTNHSPST